MTAAEGKEYGLVDEVLLTNPRKIKKQKSIDIDLAYNNI